MASRKEYTYQIKGNKLSLLEKDYSTGSGLGLAGVSTDGTQYGTSGDGLTDDIPSGTTVVQSPLSSVTDGIEIEYAYSPNYRINDESVVVSATSYDESGTGLLKLYDSDNGFPASGLTHIVISGSNKWDGLHKVNNDAALGWMILETKYNGSAVTEGFTVYTDVSALSDESSEIDVSPYLAKALVYYVKAKLAEDQMNIEVKEYMMREFRRMLEKHESSKVAGPRMIMPGPNALR